MDGVVGERAEGWCATVDARVGARRNRLVDERPAVVGGSSRTAGAGHGVTGPVGPVVLLVGHRALGPPLLFAFLLLIALPQDEDERRERRNGHETADQGCPSHELAHAISFLLCQ